MLQVIRVSLSTQPSQRVPSCVLSSPMQQHQLGFRSASAAPLIPTDQLRPIFRKRFLSRTPGRVDRHTVRWRGYWRSRMAREVRRWCSLTIRERRSHLPLRRFRSLLASRDIHRALRSTNRLCEYPAIDG